MFASRLIPRVRPFLSTAAATRNNNSLSKSNLLKKANVALGRNNADKQLPTQPQAPPVQIIREPVVKVTPAATSAVAGFANANANANANVNANVNVNDQNPGFKNQYQSPAAPDQPNPDPPLDVHANTNVNSTTTVEPKTAIEPNSGFSRTQFHQGHLHEFAPRIVVVGVGGGGGNAVNNMIANQLSGESHCFCIYIYLIYFRNRLDRVVFRNYEYVAW